ncbi:MAG: M1 family metallopeptidase [Chloroflexota bacterium]
MRRCTPLLLLLTLPLACSLPQDLIRLNPAPPGTIAPAPTLPPAYTSTPQPTPTAPLPPTPTLPPTMLELQQQAMQPEHTADLAALGPLTQYLIEARVQVDLERNQAAIEGMARILFTNPLDQPLTEIVLALWPREKTQYLADMSAGPLIVNGRVLDVEDQHLSLRARLPVPLAPGESLDLSLPFRVFNIGVMRDDVPRRFAIVDDVLIAPTFYPLLPRLVDGEWQVEAPPPGGDTTNSDAAYYTVRLTWPAGYALAATGTALDLQENLDGTNSATFVSGPVRDFAFAVGRLESEDRTLGDLRLRGWVLPANARDLDRLLDTAAAQVEILQGLLGPYPYAELDLVDAPGAFGGIEYPGLVFIGTVGTQGLVGPVVHEIGHQWFYGLVGNNQLNDPWLDEAAATYTEVLYYESAVGPERATSLLREYHDLVGTYATDPMMPIGLPVGAYASEQDYALIVYLKGALFFDALRRELGDEAFFAFLRSYIEEQRYGFAGPETFEHLAEAACSCDLGPLFDHWVYAGGPLAEP